ncbi:MAG: ATP-dependent DNA helicase RecG [Hydrotalea sp.]|nr:ATP-dependent DNA helicase RecG [Hydrotalea sp.]
MRPAILNPLFQPVGNLHGLGPTFAPLIAGLAGPRVIDLLTKLFPQKIIERKMVEKLSDLNSNLVGQPVVVRGKITHHAAPETNFKKNRPYKIYLADGLRAVTLTFFFQQGAWLKKQYPPGAEMVVSGLLGEFQGEWQISHPDIALPIKRLAEVAMVETIYPKSQNLPQKVIQKSMRAALALVPPLPEWLPDDVIKKHNLPSWRDALQKIHQPKCDDDLLPQALPRLRLAMDEILAWQIAIKKSRAAQQPLTNRRSWLLPQATLFEKIDLPFTLTSDQQNVIKDLESDFASLKKMTRLLMGDVGSGKTMIALYAMVRTIEKSMLAGDKEIVQAALLAPTEILAEQHHRNFERWLKPLGIKCVLLTGRFSKKEKDERKAMIKNGDYHIVIGTHAIIQEDVAFANLRLLVIDEQQRFGVLQRLALYQKSFSGDDAPPPDMLLMTATPIPRTLSLIQFGDLDLSTLKEKPAGRQIVETAMVSDDRLAEVIARLKKQIAAGASVFWVCPLIEDSDFMALPSAEARYELAKNYFAAEEVALIHGQMKSSDKQKIIDDFKSGRVKLLIATTVIESGIDIPRATIIIIDHAEHFGLTQLHQLRGRVGRDQIFDKNADNRAYCLLLYHAPLSDGAKKRLTAVKEHNDGFYLAERDLEWRGMGDRYGLRQSGFGDFYAFDLFFHNELLMAANQLADHIVTNNLLGLEKYQILLALYQKDRALELVKAG